MLQIIVFFLQKASLAIECTKPVCLTTHCPF